MKLLTNVDNKLKTLFQILLKTFKEPSSFLGHLANLSYTKYLSCYLSGLNQEITSKITIRTNGNFDPSGVDVDMWQPNLVSNDS